MAQGESCIVCKQQSRNNDVTIVGNTDSDGFDCKKAAVVMMMIIMMMMIELCLLLHTPPS